MARGTQRQSYTGRNDPRLQVRMGIAFLVGTVGVGIVIALALVVAMKTGSMERLQTALHEIKVPSLPSLPETNVENLVEGVARGVKSTERSTENLWERGSAGVSINRGAQPDGTNRKD